MPSFFWCFLIPGRGPLIFLFLFVLCLFLLCFVLTRLTRFVLLILLSVLFLLFFFDLFKYEFQIFSRRTFQFGILRFLSFSNGIQISTHSSFKIALLGQGASQIVIRPS